MRRTFTKASTIAIGQALPGGGNAVANGTFPDVIDNANVDGSFGIASPIYLDQVTPAGDRVSVQAIDPAQITTSVTSKSELALNRSADGHTLSFLNYKAPVVQSVATLPNRDLSRPPSPSSNHVENVPKQLLSQVPRG